MPGRYRKSKKSMRRRNWKKKGRTVNVNRGLKPFAQRYITKVKYTENLTVTGPVLGGLAQYNFRLNSIFDPNLSGTGYQPYGHDSLSSLYNRYRVIACNYVITGIVNDNTGDQYGQLIAIPANEALSLTGVPAEALTHPKARWITQAPSAPAKLLRGKVYIPSLVGRSKSQYMADDRYQAQFGTNPAENAILNVFSTMTSGISSTVTMKFSITLTYTVECFDFKNLPVS